MTDPTSFEQKIIDKIDMILKSHGFSASSAWKTLFIAEYRNHKREIKKEMAIPESSVEEKMDRHKVAAALILAILHAKPTLGSKEESRKIGEALSDQYIAYYISLAIMVLFMRKEKFFLLVTPDDAIIDLINIDPIQHCEGSSYKKEFLSLLYRISERDSTYYISYKPYAHIFFLIEHHYRCKNKKLLDRQVEG
jgi:hypothetical protein